MEERADTITFTFTKNLDPPPGPGGRFTRHFTQTEDFFLKLGGDYLTPRVRIHHDYRVREPDASYQAALEKTLRGIMALAPPVFSGLTYAFDPQEIFKPCFFKVYESGPALYLYLLRLDFGYRPHYQVIEERGDNDYSHACRTNALFLEPLLIPITHAAYRAGRLAGAGIRPLFSETWIGEYGRGYRVQGIWMDNDLTKFFSRLFLASELRVYPYYPFLCKYRTVCGAPVRFSDDERAGHVRLLASAIEFIEPALADIQAALTTASFSEDLPAFRALKPLVGAGLTDHWRGLAVRAYLTDAGQKEYELEDTAPPV